MRKQKQRTRATVTGKPLDARELRRLNLWWRAANYLAVGQIYLMDNPLLRGGTDARAGQASTPRALGNDTGLDLSVRAPESRDHRP